MDLKGIHLERVRYVGIEDTCQVKVRTQMTKQHTCIVHVKVGKHIDLLAQGIAPWIVGTNPVPVRSKSAL